MNITTLLRWQRRPSRRGWRCRGSREARGTLNLPASTKVEDLKLCLNASDCAAVMFDTVIIEVRKGGSVLKRKLDTQEQDAVVDPSWTLILSKPPAEEPPPEPLTEVRVYTHQRAEELDHVQVLSREILLWRAAYLASLGACLWVMRAGARHLLWCILGSQGAKHAALASCGVAGKPC